MNVGWKRERGVGGDTAYVEHPPTSAAIDLLRNVLSPSLRQAHRGRRHRRGRHHAHQAGGGSVPAVGDSAAGDLKMYEGIY